MIFADNLSTPLDAWVQYGCFGLLALIVSWALMKGVPAALASFKESLKSITDTFAEEARECRAERVARDTWITREFELNRTAMMQMIKAVETLKGFQPPEGE